MIDPHHLTAYGYFLIATGLLVIVALLWRSLSGVARAFFVCFILFIYACFADHRWHLEGLAWTETAVTWATLLYAVYGLPRLWRWNRDREADRRRGEILRCATCGTWSWHRRRDRISYDAEAARILGLGAAPIAVNYSTWASKVDSPELRATMNEVGAVLATGGTYMRVTPTDVQGEMRQVLTIFRTDEPDQDEVVGLTIDVTDALGAGNLAELLEDRERLQSAFADQSRLLAEMERLANETAAEAQSRILDDARSWLSETLRPGRNEPEGLE